MTMGNVRNCKTVQPLLAEYVDGVLPDTTAWDVKMHCTSCAVCNRIAEDFSATANLLRALPSEEPSLNFDARLAARLADITLAPHRPSVWERSREAIRDFWARPRMRPAFALGAVAAAMLPATVVILGHGHLTAPSQVAPVTVASAVNSSPKSGDAASSAQLRELWSGHAAYSASEPLGDPASVLVAGNDAL